MTLWGGNSCSKLDKQQKVIKSMCGFIGYYKKNSDEYELDLTSGAQAIIHRGPDMQNSTSGSGWKVNFNRLSILDLSKDAMQPFEYDGVTVFMNGEIYNYVELEKEYEHEFSAKTTCDVEIIPFLYKKYGLNFLNKLNGMFAMVIIDSNSNTKYLIEDRYGVKPLFYKFQNNRLFFASEIKALKASIDLEPDYINTAITLRCFFSPVPFTPYKDLYRLRPGSYIEYKDGCIQEKRWYHMNVSDNKIDNYRDFEDGFKELFESAVKLRLRSDVLVGSYLSGGLDSSSIVHYAHREQPNIPSFTAELLGKERMGQHTDNSNSAQFARDKNINRISVKFDHNFLDQHLLHEIKSYDDVLPNTGAMIFNQIPKVARQNNVTVIFDGVGGDEIFGGYPWQLDIKKMPSFMWGKLKFLPYSQFFYQAMQRKSIKASLAYRWLLAPHLWHMETLSVLKEIPFGYVKGRKLYSRMCKAGKYNFDVATESFPDDPWNALQYANIFTVLSAQTYMSDIGGMASSIENRSPLLDYRVFEFMMSVSSRLKLEQGVKSLFRRFARNILPTYITDGTKEGPVFPLKVWLEDDEEMAELIRSYLTNNKERLSLMTDPLTAKMVVDDQAPYIFKNPLRLYAILSAPIWHQIHVEGEDINKYQSLKDFLKCFSKK